ncbi:MAG: Rpn family recombination-promoting nuclease/putative transposase, partial [Treponema sp.]|nr:Rpn family recombination-promoting nuclease/putative transposase [Treponema sp.]
LEYYASRQFSGQDIQGEDKSYNDLAEFYQIAIIGNEKIFKDDILVHTFQFYDPVHGVSLGGKSRIITVELEKTDQIVDKPIGQMLSSERWSIFFQYLTFKDKRAKINEILEREGDIAMAGETLIQISRNEIEFAQRTSELKYILDRQDIEVTARREGFAKGQMEGRAEEKLEIARNMQKAGISTDIIFQTTGVQIKS